MPITNMCDTKWNKGNMAKVNDTNKAKYVTYWEWKDKNKGPVAPEDISEDLAEKYSDEIVARAEALKGYNKAYYIDSSTSGTASPKLTDYDYIQFALQEQYESVVDAIRTIYDAKNAKVGAPDPEWAVYSYEEILEMENNGVHIPDDVLKWAHAMQQADIGALLVVSENAQVAGGEGNAEDNSIDALKDKAKKYTKEAEKAVDDTKQLYETYKEKAQDAKKLKDLKEDTYKSEMDDIAKMTEEWKALEQKSKSSELSKAENRRFQELAKKINGKNGTAMKEIQAADAQLDAFLDSFNGIDTKIQENITLITNTEKAAKDLLGLEKAFTSEVLPHSETERAADSGLIINLLHGAKGDSIAEVAMEAAQDLTECNDEISSNVYDSENTDLAQFATEYTKAATETEENTKETMGEAFNQASPENKPKDKVDSGIPIIFSFANSMYATAKTLATTIELKSQDKKMMSRKKSLVKELHQSDKEIKTVNKEIAATQSTQESNASEEEAFLAKLDEIKGQQSNEEMTSESEDEGGVTSSATNETEEICTNLESLDNENDQATKGLQKAVGKSLAVSKKSQNLSKLLRGESVDLEKQKKVSVKTAEDTMIVGVGTTSLGIVTTAIGDAVCATAYTMLMSVYPPTVLAGAQLLQQGLLLLALGRLEMTTGITASVTGATTLAVAANVDDDLQESESTQKETTQLAKENQQVVKTASAVVVNDDGNAAETLSANVPTTSSTTSDASATTDVAPAATVDMVPMVKTKMATAGSSDEDDSETGEDANTSSPATTIATPTDNAGGTTGGTTGDNADSTGENATTDGSSQNDATTEASKTEESTSEEGGNGYKVAIGVGIPACAAAVAVTAAASVDVLMDKKDMDKKKTAYLNKLKVMDDLSKSIERQQVLVQKVNEKLAAKADSLTGEIEATNAIIIDAGENGDQEKAAVAEIDATNASKELKTLSGSAETNKFNSAVNQGNKQIDLISKDAKGIEGGLKKYDKNIENLTEVSTATMITGGATTLFGAGLYAYGTYMINQGIVHVASSFVGPPVFVIWPLFVGGILEQAFGASLQADGVVQMATGGVTTAAGGAGLLARNEAKSNKKEVEAEFKAGLPKAKDGKTIVRQSLQSVREASNETNSKLAGVPEIATSSAAATANTNTANSYETDDKVDRKLARFNNDSIIESKKKKKKVQGVSASSRG